MCVKGIKHKHLIVWHWCITEESKACFGISLWPFLPLNSFKFWILSNNSVGYPSELKWSMPNVGLLVDNNAMKSHKNQSKPCDFFITNTPCGNQTATLDAALKSLELVPERTLLHKTFTHPGEWLKSLPESINSISILSFTIVECFRKSLLPTSCLCIRTVAFKIVFLQPRLGHVLVHSSI